MSAVPPRYPPPLSPKRSEEDQFETHDFYVAVLRLEDTIDLPYDWAVDLRNHPCSFGRSDGDARLPLGLPGNAWGRSAASGGTWRFELKEIAWFESPVTKSRGAYADVLDNRPELHPTDSNIRPTPGPVSWGRPVLGDPLLG